MVSRKSFQALVLGSAFILLIALLGAAISQTGQRPINKQGKPAALRGVQITVVNRSAARSNPVSVTTDAEGAFDLGVLAAGTYSMTLKMPEALTKALPGKVQDKQYSLPEAAPAKVTVEGGPKVVVRGWDFKEKRSFDFLDIGVKNNSNLRPGQAGSSGPKPDITFTTDGKQKIKGWVHDASMAAVQNTR